MIVSVLSNQLPLVALELNIRMVLLNATSRQLRLGLVQTCYTQPTIGQNMLLLNFGQWQLTMQFGYLTIYRAQILACVQTKCGRSVVRHMMICVGHMFGAALFMSLNHPYKMERKYPSGNHARALGCLLVSHMFILLW